MSAGALTLLVLLLPLDADLRAVLSLLTGPLLGVCIHTVALSRRTAVPQA